MTTRKKIGALPLLCLAFAFTQYAGAETIDWYFSGNDCGGHFGKGFDNCAVFVIDNNERIDLSPVIAKFDSGLGLSESNDTIFPSIDGSEFSFSGTGDENETGTWLYAPGPDDPGVRFWSAKAGSGFKLFWKVNASALLGGGPCDVSNYNIQACLSEALDVTSGQWVTPSDKALSHLTFFDSGKLLITPVPAALWLFGSALGLLGWLRRKDA